MYFLLKCTLVFLYAWISICKRVFTRYLKVTVDNSFHCEMNIMNEKKGLKLGHL